MTEQIAQIIGVSALSGFYWFAFWGMASMIGHYRDLAAKALLASLGGMSAVCAVSGTVIAISRIIALLS